MQRLLPWIGFNDPLQPVVPLWMSYLWMWAKQVLLAGQFCRPSKSGPTSLGGETSISSGPTKSCGPSCMDWIYRANFKQTEKNIPDIRVAMTRKTKNRLELVHVQPVQKWFRTSAQIQKIKFFGQEIRILIQKYR